MQDPPAEQASKIRRDEIAAARAFVTDHGIEHIKVGVFAMDGILRGKYLARDKFLSALDKALGVCAVVSVQATARDDN
jgi:glutamine synthetase